MKILGVLFGVVDTERDNWQPKLNKLEKSLKWLFSFFCQLVFARKACASIGLYGLSFGTLVWKLSVVIRAF